MGANGTRQRQLLKRRGSAGDTIETLLAGYAWLEREDVLACLAYARRVVGHERAEPFIVPTGT